MIFLTFFFLVFIFDLLCFIISFTFFSFSIWSNYYFDVWFFPSSLDIFYALFTYLFLILLSNLIFSLCCIFDHVYVICFSISFLSYIVHIFFIINIIFWAGLPLTPPDFHKQTPTTPWSPRGGPSYAKHSRCYQSDPFLLPYLSSHHLDLFYPPFLTTFSFPYSDSLGTFTSLPLGLNFMPCSLVILPSTSPFPFYLVLILILFPVLPTHQIVFIQR